MVGSFFGCFASTAVSLAVPFLPINQGSTLTYCLLVYGGFFLLLEVLCDHGAHDGPLWVGLGVFLGLLTEQIVHYLQPHHTHLGKIRSKAIASLFADASHNLMDGFILAGLSGKPAPIAIGLTLGIVTHELAQEVGDVALMKEANFSMKQIIFYNGLSGLTVFIPPILAWIMDGDAVLLRPEVQGMLSGLMMCTAAFQLLQPGVEGLSGPEHEKSDETETRNQGRTIAGLLFGFGLASLTFQYVHHIFESDHHHHPQLPVLSDASF